MNAKSNILLVLVVLCGAGAAAQAQFTDPLTTTPAFLQDGFGPAGDALPFGGQSYCCPTAVSMSLSYLGINGFNQLAPSSPTYASELNLVRVMSGLMATDPIQGTLSNAALENGVKIYLAAEGISTANYTLSVTSSPTVSTLASINQPGTVVDLIGGYYNSSGNRTGGHCIALVSQAINSQGQASPNTIAVNNPLPGALTPNADVTGNVLQYLNTRPTSGNLTGAGAIELDPNQYPGFWNGNPLVIETAIALTVNTSQQSVNNPVPAAWNLSTTQTINLNSGVLPVLAPITGAGGLAVGAYGTLQLQAANTSTGANTITGATLKSTITSGQPFGTGTISIQQGTLALSPMAGTSSISLSAASAAGKMLNYGGGSVLALSLNGNTALTFAIGGNTDGVTPNLVRQSAGTLVIAPAGGVSDLGLAERVIINGVSGNLPQITNGIVSPSIVAQNNDSFISGDFVTYGGNGFVKASYTAASTTPIASAGANSIFLADTGQTVAASATVQVYALNVGAVTVGGGASSVLQVGPQSSGQSGIILNGGAISVTTLAFGAAEGVVYTSAAGGVISSAITGSGSNGLTTFGPGMLTLQGASTYSGATTIVSGTLQAKNSSGSATGSGAINVQSGGALEISGVSAKAGGAGGTTVSAGGALLLNGGTLTGTLAMNSGSYLFGSGTVTGISTVSGIIGNSATPSQLPIYTGVENITFTSKTTFNSTTIYSWRLNALDAAPADAGTNWSLLQFSSAASNLGLSGSPFHFTLDLNAALADPNSGDGFWNAPHQWLVAEDAQTFSNVWWNYDFPTFSQGSFSLSLDPKVQDLYVEYTPQVPEPGCALLGVSGLALFALRRRPTG